MIALQYWLFFVAAARLLNVVLGYLGPRYFKERVYTLKTDDGTWGRLSGFCSGRDGHCTAKHVPLQQQHAQYCTPLYGLGSAASTRWQAA
jgi:hypothetical protein